MCIKKNENIMNWSILNFRQFWIGDLLLIVNDSDSFDITLNSNESPIIITIGTFSDG